MSAMVTFNTVESWASGRKVGGISLHIAWVDLVEYSGEVENLDSSGHGMMVSPDVRHFLIQNKTAEA